MKQHSVLTRIASLTVVAIVTMWISACVQKGSELDQAAADINKDLPKPYVDELVMEHAHVDGNRLVVDIRIPDIRIAQMNPKKLPLIRNQEQGDLNLAACNDPSLRDLMKHKHDVARRFLDRDGKTIFELVAMFHDCGSRKK
ncbi:MAG TPA: hypothetical protein VK753_03685 [Xanthomonadaceae bacterium]|jgi:hypothetical protein|nr:hypothetical protein [Xanthomonadaceae bacterium]